MPGDNVGNNEFKSRRDLSSALLSSAASCSSLSPARDKTSLASRGRATRVPLLASSEFPVLCAVSEPDRAGEPVPEPGAGLSLGTLPAALRPRARRAPRPRRLPHQARFWACRYARYCIGLDQVCAVCRGKKKASEGRGFLASTVCFLASKVQKKVIKIGNFFFLHVMKRRETEN